jgi:hypothetical protein
LAQTVPLRHKNNLLDVPAGRNISAAGLKEFGDDEPSTSIAARFQESSNKEKRKLLYKGKEVNQGIQ